MGGAAARGESPPETEERPVRADVRRNRDALLASAVRAFTDHGAEVPLDEIARGAGVGIGTLYRHFPSREELVEAVYRREVAALTGGVDELLEGLPADEALEEWMRRFVGQVASARGLSAALKSVLGPGSEAFAAARAEIIEATSRLLDAAATDGLIRPDAVPTDVLRALSGFCTATDAPGGREQAVRLVGMLVDGLRYRAPRDGAAR